MLDLPPGLLANRRRREPWHGRLSGGFGDFALCGGGIEELLRNVRSRKLRCRAGGLAEGVYRFATLPDRAVPCGQLAPGTWLRVDRLESVWPEIDHAYHRLCAALNLSTGTGVTAFVHGPGTHVPRHVDSTSALVLHIEGERAWTVEAATRVGVGEFDELRPLPWGGGFGSAARRLDLGCGDWLYIPRGWWHETHSPHGSMAVRLSLAED